MAELTDDEYEAATERGRVMFETEPHARSARFDRASGMMVMELYNGCTLSVPAKRLQGLTEASLDQLEEFELSGFGGGLHWEALDADFSVSGLAKGQFGTAKFMQAQRAQLRAILAELERRQVGALAAE